jgi:hypothetical protein
MSNDRCICLILTETEIYRQFIVKYPDSEFYGNAVIWGSRRDVDEDCGRLRYSAVQSGNPLPTFRDNVSVPSSRATKSKTSSTCPQTFNFRSTSSMLARHQFFTLISVRTFTKHLVYSAPLTNAQTLHQHNLVPIKPLTTVPGPFKNATVREQTCRCVQWLR